MESKSTVRVFAESGSAHASSRAQRLSTRVVRWFLRIGATGVVLCFLLGRVTPPAIEALASPWTAHLWAATLVLLPLMFVVESTLTRRVMAPVLGVVALWSSALVGPTIIPHGGAVATGAPASPPLRVAAANVLVANQPNAAGLAWIRALDVDVLGLVECNSAWQAAAESARDDGRARWPYALVGADHRGPGGVGLFSRYPLREAAIEVPPDGHFRMASAIVEHPSGAVRVFVVHPVPPVRPRWTASRNAELAWLAARIAKERAKPAAEGGLPVVVLGDLNETPYGRAYATFLAATGMRPARSVAGFSPTWPTRVAGQSVPHLLRIPIDHCLLSPDLLPVSFVVGPDIGSDHLPIVASVRRPSSE